MRPLKRLTGIRRLGWSSGGGAVAPTVNSFLPTSAEVGETVVITGTLFTGATGVTINGVAVTAYTVDSDTQITATVPTGATTGKIAVTGPTGTGQSASNFTVENFVLTATTTAPTQTVTLHLITPQGSSGIKVYWGDGSNSTIANNNVAQTTHQYATAAAYTIRVEQPRYIVSLNLTDAKLSGTVITASNPLPANLTALTLFTALTYNVNNSPLPSGLTSLYLSGVTGLTYNVNTNPLPAGITSLTLYNLAGLTYNVNTNPLPSGLTYLNLYTLAGFTYNANTDPLPSGLTTLSMTNLANLTYNVNTDPLPSGIAGALYFYNLPGLTWQINADQPVPSGVTSISINLCNNITLTAWTHYGIRSITWESNCSAAKVDSILQVIWSNKANFTYATPVLDLLGGGNFAPNGVYQAGSPPTTGKEFAYDLVNGAYTADGPEWTVSIYRLTIATLGDSITSPNPGWTTDIASTYGALPAANRLINHAAGGATIMTSMDSQTSAAALDDADIIIVALGTNDNNGGNMATLQAEVEENLAEIKASNPRATVFYMNVLPRYDAYADKANIRAAIAAACAAQSVTCWDTFTDPWILSGDTTDGLHPNQTTGRPKIAARVMALLP